MKSYSICRYPCENIKRKRRYFWKLYLQCFQQLCRKRRLPSNLKLANITPVFKKDSKDNYQPVSILPIISKMFEKLLYKQIPFFIDSLLSNFQYGFRKGFGAQDCLLTMLEHWKSEVDKRQVFGTLLTDLSKAFDRLSHELIIAKLNAYGLVYLH